MEHPDDAPSETDHTTGADPAAEVDAKNKKMLKIAGLILLASFAFGWGSIPLYQLVCKPLLDPGGSSVDNGTAQSYGPDVEVDESRTLKIRFSATVNRQLPWKFHPEESSIEIHPGQKRLTKFYAQNLDHGRPITGKAVYDIVPSKAAPYLKKVECFCFTKQTLEPGESVDMPLYFWFDPDLPDSIDEVTIAYTFFRVEDADGDESKPTANAAQP